MNALMLAHEALTWQNAPPMTCIASWAVVNVSARLAVQAGGLTHRSFPSALTVRPSHGRLLPVPS